MCGSLEWLSGRHPFACDPAIDSNPHGAAGLKSQVTSCCSELHLESQPAYLLSGPCNLCRIRCSDFFCCSDLRTAPPLAIASCLAILGCARLPCSTENLHNTDCSNATVQASGAVVGAAPTTAAVQEAATKASPPAAAADDDDDDSDEDVDLFGEMTEVCSSDIILRLG